MYDVFQLITKLMNRLFISDSYSKARRHGVKSQRSVRSVGASVEFSEQRSQRSVGSAGSSVVRNEQGIYGF